VWKLSLVQVRVLLAPLNYRRRGSMDKPKEIYPFWRFHMWLKGYGSYDEIEKKVEEGKLTPFKEYPDKSIERSVK
jgi:hypothetical protein